MEPCCCLHLLFFTSSSSNFRMNCPVPPAEAPGPVLQPAREVSPKVELPCPHKVEAPNPTPACPLRVVPLNPTPPHLPTVLALRPPRRYLLPGERPRGRVRRPPWPEGPARPLPPLSPPVLLSPWQRRTGSTRRWAGAGESRAAAETSRQCKRDSRVIRTRLSRSSKVTAGAAVKSHVRRVHTFKHARVT